MTSRNHPDPARRGPARSVTGALFAMLVFGVMGARAPSCCELIISTGEGEKVGYPCAGTKGQGPQATAAAKDALQKLPATILPDEAAELGFADHGEVSQADLGVPFCVFAVRLDELATYTSSRPAAELLMDRHALTYPLEVSGVPRSLMIVEPLEGTWQATTFGGAADIAEYTTARKSLSVKQSRPLQDYFLVQVPALDLTFIGFEEDGKLMFLPNEDVPELNVSSKKGPRPATEVLADLAAAAAAVKKALEVKVPVDDPGKPPGDVVQ